MTPSITQAAINDALCNFIINVTGLPNQQVIVGQINRTVGAREMAQHLLSGMDKPSEPKVKRGRKPKVVEQHEAVDPQKQSEAA